ncbi:MAG TPA: 2-oxoacid:acceptor oxidoreductase subunit alpha, partial [Desulfosalsimonadaceae bacterium]|nr:2-oxoacid:acceptor oxidoreductase subunit alpha [Desulfosalsimonadaceae bacterium]
CLHFSDLWPFPGEAARSAIGDKEVFSVEQNATGQFRDLLRGQTGIAAAGSILKYDGRPLFAREIAAQWKKLTGKSHG